MMEEENGLKIRGPSSSVGAAIAGARVMNTSHPFYRAISQEVINRVGSLSVEKGESRASARPTPVTIALDTHEMARMSEDYPEFQLLNYGISRPGHSWWVQYRRLANEWMTLQVEKYTTSVAHLGGSVVPYLLGPLDDVVLLHDPSSVVAIHENHAASNDAFRLMQSYATLSHDLGQQVDRVAYESYLQRRAYKRRSVNAGLPFVEALCLDLTLYAYSPIQAASMMLEAGAKITYGCFVYHPTMLFSSEGEIPDTGVFFTKTSSGMALSYPEGVAGVVRYGPNVWESWLTSHQFSLGSGKKEWFQLELLKNRGHLMFFRMVRLEGQPVVDKVSHALDLAGASEQYLINAMRLKKFGLDPSVQESWEHSPFFASKRLVDRVYQHAMQLKSDQFTRYAIRKSIYSVNDRVTIEGTSVKVNSSLGVRLVDSLVVAIYTRAFVDRYDAGTLTAELMSVVKSVAKFSQSTWVEKATIITRMCLATLWDYTLAFPVDAFRAAMDWVRRKLSSEAVVSLPEIVTLPPYFLVQDAARAWFGSSRNSLAAVAAETARLAAVDARGFSSRWAQAFSKLAKPFSDASLSLHTFRVEELKLFQQRAPLSVVDEVFDSVRAVNEVDEAPVDRYDVTVSTVARSFQSVLTDFHDDPDPVATLNDFYAEACPGVGLQNLEYDTASISLDPQDRTLAAPYMKLPRYFGEAPVPKKLFHSRLKALNVPKRQQTTQELLSAIAARNLNAPQISLPQDDDALVVEVWNNFLDVACVPEAKELLLKYQSDPVGLAADTFQDWFAQVDQNKLNAVKKQLEEIQDSLQKMPVDEYLVMLKSDVKPTLSTKPLEARTEPQVIVYHEKAVSALFSTIFRVLVRRFLSLLKPNIHVNLLKDTRDIMGFLQGVHPFGASGLKYLENDFSKYDKSQGRFVWLLEQYVYQQLGMNEDMLNHWLGGHVACSMRALAMALSLDVMYQRKSGDATTSFGNVLLNVLSVFYAYRGTNFVWALFMGDDSLVCAKAVGSSETAVRLLAEVFNLGAKMFLTSAPYFASNFVLIDDVNQLVALVPDPVKRVERWSMSISADDPQWHERYVSACDSMRSYLSSSSTAGLTEALVERYPVSRFVASGVADAIATLVKTESNFRSIWEENPEMSVY